MCTVVKLFDWDSIVPIYYEYDQLIGRCNITYYWQVSAGTNHDKTMVATTVWL